MKKLVVMVMLMFVCIVGVLNVYVLECGIIVEDVDLVMLLFNG